jgi:outer membrane protein OmpA-like peptidoglycan-associated protein
MENNVCKKCGIKLTPEEVKSGQILCNKCNICKKCGKKLTVEEVKKSSDKEIKSGKLLCDECRRKRRNLIIAGILVAILLLSAGIYFLSKKVKSFEGVKNVEESVSVDGERASITDSKTDSNKQSTAVSASAGSSEKTIDDIASFKRYLEKASSLPAIGVLFDLNSSRISGQSENLLKEFAQYYLTTNKLAIIEIEGYTCDLGTEEFNNNLSKQRAETVKYALIKIGIPADKIDIKWYGESEYGKLGYKTKEDYRRVNISIK